MKVALVVVAVAALIVGVLLWFFRRGPGSLRAEYEAEVARGLAATVPPPIVAEPELARLPAPVARYLRVAGVVGRPRVHHFHVQWTGRIRSNASSPWMPMTADQHSFIDLGTRLFFMTATRGGIPAIGLHRFTEGAASMRVKLLGAVPLVDARGPEFTRTEAVTWFNDLCLLAPSGLLAEDIEWTPRSDTEVRARYPFAGHHIEATLVFDPATGDLVDFFSDDRPALAPDGKHFVQARWSTPIERWSTVGGRRVPLRAEARYGDEAYAEFVLSGFSDGSPAP